MVGQSHGMYWGSALSLLCRQYVVFIIRGDASLQGILPAYKKILNFQGWKLATCICHLSTLVPYRPQILSRIGRTCRRGYDGLGDQYGKIQYLLSSYYMLDIGIDTHIQLLI